jgi:hypothetical protein
MFGRFAVEPCLPRPRVLAVVVGRKSSPRAVNRARWVASKRRSIEHRKKGRLRVQAAQV